MKYTTSFIVFPKHCNHLREVIFGGQFMAEMDLAAAHCIRRLLFKANEGVEHAVTPKTHFDFQKPAYLGDLIELEAEVKSLGEKSIVVQVVAWRNRKNVRARMAIGDFVFVAIGAVDDLTGHPEFLPYKNHGLTDEDIE